MLPDSVFNGISNCWKVVEDMILHDDVRLVPALIIRIEHSRVGLDSSKFVFAKSIVKFGM